MLSRRFNRRNRLNIAHCQIRRVSVADCLLFLCYMGRAKRICYLSPMRAAKVQASLRIRAVSPEPSLLAHTSSESRGTFRQKARSVAPLNGWACAVEICHDGMLEDTNSLGGAHMIMMQASLNKLILLLLVIIVLCPRDSSFLLALWSPRLEKSELVCVLLVHLFVCFCHCSLPLGVGGWLRFVIVALPGLFY